MVKMKPRDPLIGHGMACTDWCTLCGHWVYPVHIVWLPVSVDWVNIDR